MRRLIMSEPDDDNITDETYSKSDYNEVLKSLFYKVTSIFVNVKETGDNSRYQD
jgi:hypothetical protein